MDIQDENKLVEIITRLLPNCAMKATNLQLAIN